MDCVDELMADPPLQFEQLQGEQFALSSEFYRVAHARSQQLAAEVAWQVYLNELALLSFQDWLQQWLGVPIHVLRHPNTDRLIDNRCYLRIGAFKVCVIVAESWLDELVLLPISAFQDPDQVSHLYVVLELWEMEQQASFRGFLRHDHRHQILAASAVEAGTYHLPLGQFNPSSQHLLELLCLESAWAFELAPLPLTWQQLSQQLLNVAQWCQQQGSAFAHLLGAGDPIPLIPAYGVGWRDRDRAFEGAIATLLARGMPIPPSAYGMVHPLTPSVPSLELLIAAWPLASPTFPRTSQISTSSEQEWSLLVLLGQQSGSLLPHGIHLQIRDQHHILSDQRLTTSDSWLVARVEGQTDEQFIVTITWNTQVWQLGPFTWQSETDWTSKPCITPNSYQD